MPDKFVNYFCVLALLSSCRISLLIISLCLSFAVVMPDKFVNYFCVLALLSSWPDKFVNYFCVLALLSSCRISLLIISVS